MATETPLAKTQNTEGFPVFSFRQLSDTGVLWLINRVVFHPRGFALALHASPVGDEPSGWTIEGDGSDAWRYDSDVDEDERLRLVNVLLALAAKHDGWPKAVADGD